MSLQYPQGHVFYRNLHHSYPLIEFGKGVYLYDFEGKEYLDASGGAAVVNIGHGVKEVTEAITSQANKVGYLNGLQFSHNAAEALAEKIAEFLPASDGKVYFLSSGSEAIEASIKLARQYWVEKGQSKKFQVISRKPSYHGNTLAALSASTREHYKEIFRPLLRESHMIPAPYCYRCFCGEKYPDCDLKCAYELEKKICELGKDNVSAFLTEVMGGASTGAAVPPPEYFQIIRKTCDEYEVILIADEIMTGAGRTGRWLTSHHFDLAPEIVVMGKGLAGGYFPLSALGVERSMVDVIYEKGKNFLHAQTFAHHPVGCAAGLAVLNYLQKNDLIKKCSERGEDLMEALTPLLDHPHVGDIRGQGLFIGIEFVKDKKERQPFLRQKKYVEQFIAKAMEKGLVVWPNVGHADGANGDLILLAPPFIITLKEINRISDVLSETLSEMKNFQ